MSGLEHSFQKEAGQVSEVGQGSHTAARNMSGPDTPLQLKSTYEQQQHVGMYDEKRILYAVNALADSKNAKATILASGFKKSPFYHICIMIYHSILL